MLQECILAVVDGKLPSVFRGAQDDAERARILDELIIDKRVLNSKELFRRLEGSLSMLIRGKWLDLELFRDPEQRNFKVEGIEFEEGTQFGPTTKSKRTMRRARKWLDHCVKNHQDCGKTDPGFRPDRLLDLRGNRIRLIEKKKKMRTDEIMAQAQYVCLSHRWGCEQHRRLQTTTKTIESHKENIPHNELPKTFQDAIRVSRLLKINYLWIDSLCILQEVDGLSAEEKKKTEEDFATQNAAMGKIYQNSHFTICASISTHMDGGLFSKKWSSLAIDVVNDSGENAVFHIRGKTSHEGPPTDLETRGWTYQEYVLPSRILGFESFDISWSCKKFLNCECGKILDAHDWRLPFSDHSKERPDSETAGKEWWAATVRYYSKRSLTNEQDKLPALSGLAQLDGNVSGDTYLAGIWEASLPGSLCWYYWRRPEYASDLGRVSIGRWSQKFRAPSWSWASIDTLDGGECCFWEFDIQQEVPHPLLHLGEVRMSCTLVEVTCKRVPEDRFGTVLGAFIKLGVNLISASIDGKNDQVIESHTEAGKAWLAEMAWTLSNVQDGWEVEICIADCSLEDCALNLRDKVYCAPILESFSDEGGFWKICLVLRCLEGHIYQRIGFCILGAKELGWDEPGPSGEEVFTHRLQYIQDEEVYIVIF